jgi:hypothetical protein
LRLSLKPFNSIGIRDKRVGQDLDRHVAVQTCVAGMVDLG